MSLMKALLTAALVAILSTPAALAASLEEMFPGVVEQMPASIFRAGRQNRITIWKAASFAGPGA